MTMQLRSQSVQACLRLTTLLHSYSYTARKRRSVVTSHTFTLLCRAMDHPSTHAQVQYIGLVSMHGSQAHAMCQDIDDLREAEKDIVRQNRSTLVQEHQLATEHLAIATAALELLKCAQSSPIRAYNSCRKSF